MNKSVKWFLGGASTVAALWMLSGMPQESASTLVSDAPTDVSAYSQLPSTNISDATPAPPPAQESNPVVDTEVVAATPSRPDQFVVPAADPAVERGSRALSPRVFQPMSEAQAHLKEDQWEEAVTKLNALYADMDDLNSFEQTTLLNFYVATVMHREMYGEAILAFERILTIADINTATESRAMYSVGQLYSQQGDHAAAVRHLTDWLTTIGGEQQVAAQAPNVLLHPAISHNALGQHPQGIAAVENYLAMRARSNQKVLPEAYQLLQSMRDAVGKSGGAQSVN